MTEIRRGWNVELKEYGCDGGFYQEKGRISRLFIFFFLQSNYYLLPVISSYKTDKDKRLRKGFSFSVTLSRKSVPGYFNTPYCHYVNPIIKSIIGCIIDWISWTLHQPAARLIFFCWWVLLYSQSHGNCLWKER